MLTRQYLMGWALAEYKAKGASAADVDEMSGLFDYHFTEAIKQCVLGSPIHDAHAAVSSECRKLNAPSPAAPSRRSTGLSSVESIADPDEEII